MFIKMNRMQGHSRVDAIRIIFRKLDSRARRFKFRAGIDHPNPAIKSALDDLIRILPKSLEIHVSMSVYEHLRMKLELTFTLDIIAIFRYGPNTDLKLAGGKTCSIQYLSKIVKYPILSRRLPVTYKTVS